MEQSFKDILKELRLKRSMSQDDLAVKIGSNRVSISGYENGRATPDYETLVRIAELFNVTTDYLLGRPGAQKHAHKDELTTDEQRMMDQFLQESKAMIMSKGNVSEAQLEKLLRMMALEFEYDLKEARDSRK